MAGDLLPPDPLGGGYGLMIAGVALMWADELDAAAQLYAGLRAEARRQGSVVLLAAAAGQSALVNERRGALAEAVADAQEALALGREAAGTEALLNSARAAAITAALEQGQPVDESVLDGEPDTMPYMLVLHARAEARAARGDLSGAVEAFQAVRRLRPLVGRREPGRVRVALARRDACSPSSAPTTRRPRSRGRSSSWRARSGRRARSASRCAWPARSARSRRCPRSRRPWPCWRRRPRGWSSPARSWTSARRSAAAVSAPRPASRSPAGSTWRRAPAPRR